MLVISLALHGVFLMQNASLSFIPTIKKEKLVAVQYVKSRNEPIKTKTGANIKSRKIEPLIKLPDKIYSDIKVPSPVAEKNNIYKSSKFSLSQQPPALPKPTFIKPDSISIKKKIVFSLKDAEKNNNSPSYTTHSEIVREKIKRSLYQTNNRLESGQLEVSFILTRDGTLKDIRLKEENSSASQYLREISINAIKNAAPYPSFPKNLDYPILTFNVIISFEVE